MVNRIFTDKQYQISKYHTSKYIPDTQPPCFLERENMQDIQNAAPLLHGAQTTKTKTKIEPEHMGVCMYCYKEHGT